MNSYQPTAMSQEPLAIRRGGATSDKVMVNMNK